MQRPAAEEKVNALTHAIGIVLAIVASFFMIPAAIGRGDLLLTISIAVYLVSMIGVFSMSTLSHYYTSGEKQLRYRALDQAFIYFAIVATYTPFSVAYLKAPWWWGLLGLMWVIAIAGFLSKTLLSHRINSVAIWFYLLLGWLPALGGMPWAEEMPWNCVLSIVGGGLIYSIGTIFLLNDQRVPWFHAIWHLFVIGASAAHYFGIFHFVIVPVS